MNYYVIENEWGGVLYCTTDLRTAKLFLMKLYIDSNFCDIANVAEIKDKAEKGSVSTKDIKDICESIQQVKEDLETIYKNGYVEGLAYIQEALAINEDNLPSL